MKEIVVVARDRVGLIADITYLLANGKINIDNMTATLIGNEGVIQLSVKDEKKAKALLEANGFKVMSSENIVVILDDRPGEMSNMARKMADNKINIENIHLVSTAGGKQIYAIKVDKPKKAKKILEPFLTNGTTETQ